MKTLLLICLTATCIAMGCKYEDSNGMGNSSDEPRVMESMDEDYVPGTEGYNPSANGGDSSLPGKGLDTSATRSNNSGSGAGAPDNNPNP